jgi:hypothetical protein
MLGRLDDSLRQLLVEALPGLFGGDAPPVQLSIVDEELTMDAGSTEPDAGEPRIDDQLDEFAFDPGSPAGPYTLTKPPLAGVRRYRLTTAAGDRVTVHDSEILVAADDPRVFRLQANPERDLAAFTTLQVLYGVSSVFARLKGTLSFKARLESSTPARLEEAEALAIAVMALNRRPLIAGSSQLFSGGDYSAAVSVDTLVLLRTTAPTSASRLMHCSADVALRVARGLRDDEGRPIRHIRTPGRGPLDPRHPVDIAIEVDA